ncbi:Rap-GAP domain-containing protein [Entamoeba marina]
MSTPPKKPHDSSNQKLPEKKKNEKKKRRLSFAPDTKVFNKSFKGDIFSSSASSSEASGSSTRSLIEPEPRHETSRRFIDENQHIFANPSNALYFNNTKIQYIRPNKKYLQSQSVIFQLCDDSILCSSFQIYDCWSSLELPHEDWVIPDKKSVVPLVSHRIRKHGYHIEEDRHCITQTTDLSEYAILYNDNDWPFYKSFYAYNKFVRHYISSCDKSVLSVIKLPNKTRRGLWLNPNGFVRLILPANIKPEEWDVAFPTDKKVKAIENSVSIDQTLMQIEEVMSVKNYSFGILYSKGIQTENEIFQNTECSPAFWKFMDLIGHRIQLKGWSEYRGGLDVVDNKTGTESYCCHFAHKDIMFHVGPLLPKGSDSEQCLERKRHIGNDVVVLIFFEKTDVKDTLNPMIFNSHFNTIFIIVTPTNDETNVEYKVTIATKPDIVPFPPFIKQRRYPHHSDFTRFLISKMINGERTALRSSVFSKSVINTFTLRINELTRAMKK